MTQTQLIQKQYDRIIAILNDDNATLNAGYEAAAVIETRLPALILMPGTPVYTPESQGTYKVETVWNLHLYVAKYGDGLSLVNMADVISWVDNLANTFLDNEQLRLNDNGLQFVRNAQWTVVSDLSEPIRYPPRNGQDRYWGFQSRLTVTAYTVTGLT